MDGVKLCAGLIKDVMCNDSTLQTLEVITRQKTLI